ncbi:uncharacterized protein LOC131243976 [Magnolia sinica]|uniref:uncharacterized protein LOC131243976 n=1 Tax=Magnolia sinica TaxID=86752 RepID=UPI00265A4048|nr:uncharacterized protein LOC131243976 [Magnolia sinica]XP_058099622.1 uncharacterized protein LOC131243976 [Magnolia sinica]
MGAATCLQWSQTVVPHSLPASQTFASAISSPSSSKRRRGGDRSLICRFVRQQSDRSALFGTKLVRSRSCEKLKSSKQTLRRACSATLESFSDEEFAKKLQELALRFHLSDEENNTDSDSDELLRDGTSESCGEISYLDGKLDFSNLQNARRFELTEPPWATIRPEPPDWTDEIIPASIERKANSVELPLSLRILKRKKQWQEGFVEAGESAYCSVKKAFSSMVFIIRELQSFTLQMREVLFYEDLQGILVRVQKEMHASFVWLFQQIFSRTPTLMVYVMILLANFTVYSMGNTAAIAAAPPPGSYEMAETVAEVENQRQSRFDPLSVKSFSISGKTASVGGSGDGGGKVRPVAGATDGGDGRFEELGASLNQHRSILPDEMASTIGRNPTVEDGVPGAEKEREVKLWNTVVEEASRMQAGLRDESLDHETMQRFVSPVTVEIEPEDYYAEHFRTELMYQQAVSEEPENPLLLSNYAQFLFLVVHDHDRAEEYFKRAAQIQPPDAESLSRYASFLWLARKDITAAEDTYLEAIAADPSNTFHAANYAHFLWSTGGEDTCFPLDNSDEA